MSIASFFASLFSEEEASNIAGWIAHFLHLRNSGIDIPKSPTPGGSPVTVPPGPPKPEPAPAPAPAPTGPVIEPLPDPPLHPDHGSPAIPLPEGVLAVDARGFCQLIGLESARSANPDLLAKMPKWWAIELDGYPESFEARGNLTEAKMGLLTAQQDGSLNMIGCVSQAFAMTSAPGGFGYARGLPYDDALSFMGDNRDQAGNIIYHGPRPGDMTAFAANCLARYHAQIAAGVDPVRAAGELPIIDHSHSGPVAV